MIIYIVQFILVLLFLRSNARSKGTWLSSSGFLLIIYAIAAALAIPTLNIDGYVEARTSAYWLPMLMFLFCLGTFIVPFCRFNERTIEQIVLPNMTLLNAFTWFIIAVSFFAISFFSSSVNMIFALGNLGDARNALYSGEMYVEVGLFNTIASVGASMYVFALLLFFVYSIIGNNKFKCILLLISSVSEPLHILSYVGRDGVVFWLFSFIFLFLLFRPFMQEDMSKRILKYFGIGTAILMLPFLAISVSRFDSTDAGTDGAMISYMGQSFVGGPLYMGIDDKPFNEGASFPLFYEITGIKQNNKYEVGGGMLQIGEWKSWHFSTFVISLYMNFHFVGLMLLAIVCAFLQKKVLGKARPIFSFECFFIYILFFQVYSQGVFYFKQYTRGGNLFILICLMLYLIFKVSKKSSAPLVRQQ